MPIVRGLQGANQCARRLDAALWYDYLTRRVWRGGFRCAGLPMFIGPHCLRGWWFATRIGFSMSA